MWAAGINGSNVVVAVVDDGIDHKHPDLSSAYVIDFPFLKRLIHHTCEWKSNSVIFYVQISEYSYDFSNHNTDAAPVNIEDIHGTMCAGEIVASANDVCGVGVAPGAKLVGKTTRVFHLEL